MIKYMNLNGYRNMGELGTFSHIYQLVESVYDNPTIILIHAYECESRVYKGYLYNTTKKYKSIPLEKVEIEEIEKYVGKLIEVKFGSFIIGTIFEDGYSDFSDLNNNINE